MPVSEAMEAERRAPNLVSISVAPTTEVIQRRYYDLPGTMELMRLLWLEAVVDGVEFQNMAEWDNQEPPRDERDRRLVAWKASEKYTIAEIAALLQEAELPVLSVHANRDVGACLCTGLEEDVQRGRRLIHEALSLAQAVQAPVCVFHLWDTWREDFDWSVAEGILREMPDQYPGVKASVENVPTNLAGRTPFELVRRFEWITLDLWWAALYDELDRFESVKDRIVNIHLRGRLEAGEWVLEDAPFGFYEALDTVKYKWGYTGPLTMEPAGVRDGDWESLLAAMATLKAHEMRTAT
ncbi:MAG: hypothetical protein GTN93_03730 [Anaerolineae bacterium]|nr:hypothetical protein [Anaerolineae bacterium]